jgi:hypothetical protein
LRNYLLIAALYEQMNELEKEKKIFDDGITKGHGIAVAGQT